MLISRRSWLSMTIAGAWSASVRRVPAQSRLDVDLERRIRRVIQEYGDQGFHRTGTSVDRRSGDWLFELASRIGVAPAREDFSLSRVDPHACHLLVGDERIEGLPLHDGTFTGPDGVRGRMGPIDTDAAIGLVEAPPNTAAAGPLGEARRQNRHSAIVCVTRGARAGLCPNNADAFLRPFGPPVVQVSSEHGPMLGEHAKRGTVVQLIASVTRTPATSFNVTATIPGAGRSLAPLVVMTPRSGWYACASERGGGIACWLELMRVLHDARPARDVVFAASSGHELGHLGINAFVASRPGVVSRAAAWMHFGANIGAAAGSGTTIQASDDNGEATLSRELDAADIAISRRVPRGTVPGGEAEVVHRGGGRYVSVIGSNALFHHPADRGAQTVDVNAIARFTKAFAAVATALSAQPSVELDEQILIDLERHWNNAFYQKDLKFIENILADEFVATYDDGSRGDKAKELALTAEFNQQVESAVQEDFTVKVYRDTALVWFTLRVVGIRQGQPATVTFRYTDVWVMREGRWQCVSTHSTKANPR